MAIRIDFSIPDRDEAEALAGFLEVHPNITHDPLLWSGAPLSDANWLKFYLRDHLNEVINRGFKARDRRERYTPPPTRDFVSESAAAPTIRRLPR